MPDWYPTDPYFIKPREATQISAALQAGKIAIIPSDSGYALLCRLGDKNAAQRIRQIRALDKNHPFTLVCADLSHLAQYARVDNVQFRLLKTLFPGPYTTILPASKEAPRLVQHEKRKTIGIRVPNHPIIHHIIETHGEALMGISLSDSESPSLDPHDLEKSFINAVDLIIDIGEHPVQPTTVLDLTEMPPTVLRQGVGEIPL